MLTSLFQPEDLGRDAGPSEDTAEDHSVQMVAILYKNDLKAENAYSHPTKKEDPAVKHQLHPAPWLSSGTAPDKLFQLQFQWVFWLSEGVCPVVFSS